MSIFDSSSLPIYAHEDEIIAAVRQHRVVVIEGATGSGKTTQIPRILLRAQLSNGLIGITQPRRIAAVSVARRVAEEEAVVLGEEVGYAIRFDYLTGPKTQIRIMTDGILLQEVRTDPDFGRYGIVMVDEAHERSLNIDLTLGLLSRALRARPDLKVIVSSATLKPEEFQSYFSGIVDEDVPVVSVRGRTFPIKTRYRPNDDGRWSDLPELVAQEVSRIHRDGNPGHVLCFLPGQGMIDQSIQAIKDARLGRDLVTLPLFARLTREEQDLVFDDFGGRRKVILATNIAETSITIPDVRFVVDSGLAKVPYFDPRNGITALREERISRASAEQRAGRAGRTAPGEVIRLYSKSDLARQPEFTREEILRLDLSEVALRLIDLGVKEVESFDFPTNPPKRQLKAAINSLREMGAIDEDRNLTAIGKRMVPFPLSPPLARMVVEAAERFPKVLDETLVAASFLSVRNPFLFPLGEEIHARRAHRRLAHADGDTLTAISVYKAYSKAKDRAGYCEHNYLDPDVMAFLGKAHRQLKAIANDLDMRFETGGDPKDVIRCLAAGFPKRLLLRRGQSFISLTGERVAIHPSSVLFRTKTRLIVAAELVLSRRTWARHCSVMDPDWLHDVNPEAAQLYGARRSKRDGGKKRRSSYEAEVPNEIDVGGVQLTVERRRHKRCVLVFAHQVPDLLEADLSELPEQVGKWPAQLMTDSGPLGRKCSLENLLAYLPHIKLPDPNGQYERAEIEGALLDPRKNWGTLEPWLGRLLEPFLPDRGKKPGWLAVVANGLGEFWLEVIFDFWAAVQTNVLSLNELIRELGGDEDLGDMHTNSQQLARLKPLVEAMGELRDGIEQHPC